MLNVWLSTSYTHCGKSMVALSPNAAHCCSFVRNLSRACSGSSPLLNTSAFVQSESCVQTSQLALHCSMLADAAILAPYNCSELCHYACNVQNDLNKAAAFRRQAAVLHSL